MSRGEDVHLNLDPDIQAVTEDVLSRHLRDVQADNGAVVLDRRTARVLALASYPPFDPNHWHRVSPDRWTNHPLQDIYEPGSVIKPLAVASLLDLERISRQDHWQVPMSRKIGRFTIHDAVPHPATLQTRQVLRYSSNVGMSLLIEKMTAQEQLFYLQKFGLGAPFLVPGFSLPHGTLRSVAAWGDIGKATAAFGQGITVSTLQLAAAFNVLANRGRYMPPTLLSGPLPAAHQVVKEGTAKEMREALRWVTMWAAKPAPPRWW